MAARQDIFESRPANRRQNFVRDTRPVLADDMGTKRPTRSQGESIDFRAIRKRCDGVQHAGLHDAATAILLKRASKKLEKGHGIGNEVRHSLCRKRRRL